MSAVQGRPEVTGTQPNCVKTRKIQNAARITFFGSFGKLSSLARLTVKAVLDE